MRPYLFQPLPDAAPVYIIPEETMGAIPWIIDTIRLLGKGTIVLVSQQDAGVIEEANSDVRIETFQAKSITGADEGLGSYRCLFSTTRELPVLLRHPEHPWGYETYYTFLRLAGIRQFTERTPDGERIITQSPHVISENGIQTLLIKTAGGIGNVILTTGMVAAALNAGKKVYFCPTDNTSGQTLADLFHDSGPPGLITIYPERLSHIKADAVLNIEDRRHLGAEDYFISPFRKKTDESEYSFYAAFFTNVTGIPVDPAATFVGGAQTALPDALRKRIVICPGSKTGWDIKRWPHMDRLVELLPEPPLVLCRQRDLAAYGKNPMLRPIRSCRAEMITHFSLSQAAGLLREARLVIANDCGMAHAAAAAGTPTLILFGPSSIVKNRHPEQNVRILSLGLPCQPCQGKNTGSGRFVENDYDCDVAYRCFRDLSAEMVLDSVRKMLS